MKLEIVSEKKNALAKNEEVRARIEHAGARTPSRMEILEEAARKLKKDKSLIIVDSIFSDNARPASEARILVYPSAQDVPAHKLEKMKRRMKQSKEQAEPQPGSGGARPQDAPENAGEAGKGTSG
jgi:ribosomal protein S24E